MNVSNVSKPAAHKPVLKTRTSRTTLPLYVLLYGTEGIGKSTFGAGAPKPIFLDLENGTSRLDVDVFEPTPTTATELYSALEAIEKGDHDFKTLVIDTVDALESIIERDVCRRNGKENIMAFGYGKGVDAALDEWRVFLERIERVRRRGMNVLFLGHSAIKKFSNPEGDDYERYALKVRHQAAGLLKERVDAALFVSYETYTHEKSGRIKGIATGARVIHTERTAAFDAKNRYGLPPKLPLDWEEFEKAAQARKPETALQLRDRIKMLLAETDDQELTAKVSAFVDSCGDDAEKLRQAADRVAFYRAKKEQES